MRQGVIKWEFRPEILDLETTVRAACRGAQTRGLAYADGRIFFSTLDGQLFALDAETGDVVWRAENANITIGESVSAMPLVVNDKVIIGVAGGERGVRGHVTAYNIDTGRFRWRYYSMGPNNEVGIGSRFDPFYPDDRIPDPALDSWFGDSWQRGGGSVWGWFTFDPELNLLAISEFPKGRKYLISLSFRGKASVRPAQVGGFDVNIVIHGSTAVRGRGDLVAYRWALWKLTAPWTHRTRPPHLGKRCAFSTSSTGPFPSNHSRKTPKGPKIALGNPDRPNLFYYGTSNCSPWNPDYRREWGVVELDEQGGLTGYRNN